RRRRRGRGRSRPDRRARDPCARCGGAPRRRRARRPGHRRSRRCRPVSCRRRSGRDGHPQRPARARAALPQRWPQCFRTRCRSAAVARRAPAWRAYPSGVPPTSNGQIADALDELGDLYELDGAVVHRVLAYRNAAKVVRDAPVSVAALTREGRVTELAGIGATLEQKIRDLIETGEIPAAVKLRARFPPGLLAITALPGLGPKRARRLFDELSIDSPQALREAAAAQKLRTLRGFGARFEESIVAALDAAELPQRRVRRTVLDRALESAELLLGALRELDPDARIELA